MTDINNSQSPNLTNPLQNNNAALMIIGYAAGILATKFTFFDFATWNYIIFSLGGVVLAGGSYVVNRKSQVITATANMTEVKSVALDKSVTGASTLGNITLANVQNVEVK